MGIRKKLLVSFFTIGAGLLLVGLIQVYFLKHLGGFAKQVSEVNLVNLSNLIKVQSAQTSLEKHLEELKLPTATASSLEESLLYIGEAESNLLKNLELFKSVATDPSEDLAADQIKAIYEPTRLELIKLNEFFSKNKDEALAAVKAANATTYTSEIKKVSGEINKLMTGQSDSGYKLSQTIRKEATQAEAISLTLVLVLVATSLIFAWRFSNAVVKSLAAASSITNEGSQALSNSSAAMIESSTGLSAGVSQLTQALQTSSNDLSDVAQLAVKVADQSNVSVEKSKQNELAAIDGQRAMELLKVSFEKINSSTQGLLEDFNLGNKNTRRIFDSLSQIELKTKAIDEIVFQTRILSFNASVEASRAGESGKGFAVVAEEIGNLAQMSGQASLDISAIIKLSFSEVEKIVSETETKTKYWEKLSQENLKSGMKQSDSSSSALAQILEIAQAMSAQADQVRSAIGTQKQKISQINDAISELESLNKVSSLTAYKNQQVALEIKSESERSLKAADILGKIING